MQYRRSQLMMWYCIQTRYANELQVKNRPGGREGGSFGKSECGDGGDSGVPLGAAGEFDAAFNYMSHKGGEESSKTIKKF